MEGSFECRMPFGDLAPHVIAAAPPGFPGLLLDAVVVLDEPLDDLIVIAARNVRANPETSWEVKPRQIMDESTLVTATEIARTFAQRLL